MGPRLSNEQMLTGSIVGHPVGSAHSLLIHCCNWECKGHSFPIATVDGQNPALRVRSLPSLVIIIIIIIINININININITNNTVRYIDPCKSCHCFVARKHTILVNWSRRCLGVSPENVLANRNSAVSRLRACRMDYKNIIATFCGPNWWNARDWNYIVMSFHMMRFKYGNHGPSWSRLDTHTHTCSCVEKSNSKLV